MSFSFLTRLQRVFIFLLQSKRQAGILDSPLSGFILFSRSFSLILHQFWFPSLQPRDSTSQHHTYIVVSKSACPFESIEHVLIPGLYSEHTLENLHLQNPIIVQESLPTFPWGLLLEHQCSLRWSPLGPWQFIWCATELAALSPNVLSIFDLYSS